MGYKKLHMKLQLL